MNYSYVFTFLFLALALPVGNSYAEGYRCFHLGNSLTDSQGELTKLIAHAAGYTDHHNDRHTIPGTPINFLYHNPDGGFGTKYPKAFDTIPPPPWDHMTLQPFIAHGRSVDNRAHYSKLFYEFAIKKSPDIQLWHYFQYRSGKSMFEYENSQLFSIDEWLEVMETCYEWHEAGFFATDDSIANHRPLAIPTDLVLIRLAEEVKAGNMPGISSGGELFPFLFASDGYNIHMTEEGRYFTALVHFACYYKEDPSGLPAVGRNNRSLQISSEQLALMQKIVWETVKAYPYTGIYDPDDNENPSAPTGVKVVDLDFNGVTLSWNASTDNKGILGYELHMDGNRKAFTFDTMISFNNWPYVDEKTKGRGMDPGEQHTYTIRAIDAGGNVSSFSSELAMATLNVYEAETNSSHRSEDVDHSRGGRNFTNERSARINASGGWIEWDVTTETGGPTVLKVHYLNSDTSKDEYPCKVIVNGSIADTINFEPVVPFKESTKIAAVPIEMRNGDNTIRLEALTDKGSPELDNIALFTTPSTSILSNKLQHSMHVNNTITVNVCRRNVSFHTHSLSNVRLFNMQGECLISKDVPAGKIDFNLNKIPAGVYILKLKEGKGISYSQFILQ